MQVRKRRLGAFATEWVGQVMHLNVSRRARPVETTRWLITILRALVFGCLALIATALPAAAQDATWASTATVAGPTPGTYDYSAAANWTPATVPSGTAYFGASTTTNIVDSYYHTTVGGWTFNAGASNYTFSIAFLEFQGAGIVVNGGSVTINTTANVFFENSSSAGSAAITNNVDLFFSGSSTAGSATVTNNVDLFFSGSSTAGSATVTNNNLLSFSQTATGGSARFINGSSGNIDLSRLTSAGMTAGSIEGGGAIHLGSKNLAVGGNNLSTTFSGVLQDGGLGGGIGGSLSKVGTGTLTLTGANIYTGATDISGGALVVNGSIAPSSLTTVENGAMLAGTGTVGATQVNAGGTLAAGSGTPGSSMTLASLALQSGALYMVSLNPSTSSFANVTGNASLNSAAQVAASFATGTYVSKQYTIMTAGSITGTFNPTVLDTNLPSGFHTSLSYDATHVYLDLSLFTPPAGTGSVNQLNVANTIVNFFNTNGSIPLAFGGGLTPASLTQLSGEGATGSQQTTFDAMNQFMGVMTDPFITGRGNAIGGASGPNAYADESMAYAAKARSSGERDAYAAVTTKAPPLAPAFEQRWSVWAAGFGGSQRTDGNAVVGSNDARSSVYGTAVGADYRFSPNTIAGFAMAGGGTNFSVNTLGTGRSDLFQVGAFIRHTNGPAYVTAALAYGWQDITTDRMVTVAGLDHLRAEFNANAWSGRVEGGYRFVAQGFGLTPYAAGQFTTFDLPAYAEQAIVGSNQFALDYNSRSVTDARSELGLRTDKSFAAADGILTLRGRVAWAHDFDPNRSIAATFQTLPGASFVVNGAATAADSALVTAAVEKKWLNGWSAALTFEGEFSNVTTSYAGKGVVRYAW